MQLGRILVPTDFSASATRAAELALAIAGSVGGRVTLLYVYAAPSLMTPDGSTFVASPAELLAITEHAEAQLADFQRRVEAHAGGVPVEARAALGVAAPEILRLADSGEFDLVVMGTHGRRGLGRLVLGSVAETVMRGSIIPVVTVRAGAEAQPTAHPAAP